MAVRRISPGIYEVNGKRVNAVNEAQALKMAGGGKPGKPGPGAPGDPRILKNKTKINNVSTAVEASEDVAKAEAGLTNQYTNPTTQTGALGDTREVIYDAEGKPIEVKDTLSAGQQGIADADTAVSQAGRDAALNQLGTGQFSNTYTPQTANRTVGGDLFGADRTRIEDAVFRNLTRNTQRDKQREWNDQEQVMADRGIAIDPRDQSYARAQEQHNQRYDDINANAMDRATMLGGQELTNAFGMQEQTIANQHSQGWGSRNNQRNEMAALSQLGPGLQTSNMQGFQGTGVDIADPVATDLAQKQLKLQKQAQQAAINKLGSGGQQSNNPAAPESPFNA